MWRVVRSTPAASSSACVKVISTVMPICSFVIGRPSAVCMLIWIVFSSGTAGSCRADGVAGSTSTATGMDTPFSWLKPGGMRSVTALLLYGIVVMPVALGGRIVREATIVPDGGAGLRMFVRMGAGRAVPGSVAVVPGSWVRQLGRPWAVARFVPRAPTTQALSAEGTAIASRSWVVGGESRVQVVPSVVRRTVPASPTTHAVLVET